MRAASAINVIAICVIAVGSELTIEEDDKSVIHFLQMYGYLNEKTQPFLTNANHRILRHAIGLFQEYYELPGNGRLNNETLNLMSKPRCGLRDIVNLETAANTAKWPKTHLTWNFQFADKSTLDTTQKAFDLWQANSTLTFERDVRNPNILISWREGRHVNVDPRNGELCSTPLDGPGGVLAHAFYPSGDPEFTSEVHVDRGEPWHIYLHHPSNKYLLLRTLAHEIGHSLGLPHSNRKDSLMYAFASDTNYPIVLSKEDVVQLQNLYGSKDTNESSTPATPVFPPPSAPSPVDLCDLKRVDAILLLEKRLYVAYGRYVWSIDVNGNTYGEPLLLSNYMKFLPSNFTRLSAAYQSPAGHLILFVNNNVYKVTYPDFTLVPNWPKTFRDFGLPANAKVHAAVNTNKGRTYVMYDGHVVGEVDDCSDIVAKHHPIQDIFPGIPTGVRSAFRYLDGNLYFLSRQQFYKFNEFTKTVLSAGKFDIGIVGIACPRDGLLQQLRDLLGRIARSKDLLRSSNDGDDDEEKEEEENENSI